MTGSDDDLSVTQWAATVVLLLVLLVPAATALAAWARRRYTRAVLRWQAALADAMPATGPGPGLGPGNGDRTPPATAAPAAGRAAAAAPAALQIDLRPARGLAGDTHPARASLGLRRRVLAVQFVAGLLYWWVLLLCAGVALAHFESVTAEATLGAAATNPAAPAAATEASSASAVAPAPPPGAAGDAGTEPEPGALALHFVLWPLLVLPALLGWSFQAGLPERRIWAGTGLAALAFGAGLAAAGAGVPAAAAVAGSALLLAALLAAFLRPAVRGAGPPLVAALTVGLAVFSVLVAVVVSFDDGGDEATTLLEDLAAIGALGVLLAVSAWVAWRTLLRLARRYAEKRFSEMQLALGAYWGLATALTCGGVLFLSFDDRTGAAMEWVALAVALVWLVWRALQRAALWLARRGAPTPLGALLMLRVFKPSHRSEAFTDRFLARWRFAGPVWMIAGPDLAGAYMEPDEFFAFLGGRLRERFIAREDEVPARVAALDDVRDPDGRFRVNELFCSNSTWQAAVRALIDRAGVVLLDLREFTPARAGTRYELEQLLQRVPLSRVVVVTDARADPAPLRASIEDAWRHVGSAVRHPDPAPVLTLLTLEDGHGGDLRGLVAAVARASAAEPAIEAGHRRARA